MADQPERRYTVVLVEDNTDLLELLVPSLKRLGNFDVFVATDGVAGLEAYYQHHPDCMVIDVKMPKMDGYQLVRAIRGDPASANLPLVIMTALAQERDQFAGYAAGADSYLIKPVMPQDLVQAVRRAIQLSEEERARQLEDLFNESEPGGD